MDAMIRVPSGTSKRVFVAFLCCGILVVLMLSLSTLVMVRPDAFPWNHVNRSAHDSWLLREHEADVSVHAQDITGPEDRFATTDTPPVPISVQAPPQRTRDRGSFQLLPAELYNNSSHQYFCFYQ
ncbi:hypothetical protein V5799_010489, partial [Amblyomma americanum]